MASERLTFRATTEASAVIGEGGRLSARIHTIATRYGEVVKRCRPALTRGQWCAVFDALNGTLLEPDTIAAIWMDIDDAEGLGDKWNVDQQQLTATLRGMSYGELVAVAELRDRFWEAISAMPGFGTLLGSLSGEWQSHVHIDQTLAKNGLRPSIETTLHALLPHRIVVHTHSVRTIALAIRDTVTGQRVFCAPGLAQPGSDAFEWMQGADCLLMDCPAADAAPDWLAALRALPARHKVLLGAPAHAMEALGDDGIALAYDGMEIQL